MTRQFLTPDSRRCFDTKTKERSSREMIEIVENVFRKAAEAHAAYLKAKEEYARV